MLAFLGTIVAEIIAGLALHGITQGFSNSGGNQTVYIENAYFYAPETRLPRSKEFTSEDFKSWAIIGLFIFILVVIVFVGGAALFAKNINLILNVGYWSAIVMATLSVLLITVGLLQGRQTKDWSIAQVAFYSLALSAAVGGLVWLIYDPPNAPSGYYEMLATLQNLNLNDDSWTSQAIEIGMGDEPLTINPIIKFLFWQAIGILPLFITIILVFYVQIKLMIAVVRNDIVNIPFFALVSAPIVAFISSLLLGLFG